MAPPLSDTWQGAIGAINRQGQPFADEPISPSGMYYAFLSKADMNAVDGTYDCLFEVVTKEWLDNVLFSRTESIRSPLPHAPALLYHLTGISQSAILGALGLTTPNDLAEGSWYLLSLSESVAQDAVSGDLYHPDIDLAPST